MAILCKTKLLFVAEAFEIKNVFKFLILFSTNVWIQLFLAEILLKSRSGRFGKSTLAKNVCKIYYKVNKF